MVGTGFFVGNGVLLTAAHNVQGCKQLNIGSDQVGQIAVSVLRADRKTDLALLQAPAGNLPPPVTLLPGNFTDNGAGSSFTVFGFPGADRAAHATSASATMLNGDVHVGKPADPDTVLWLHSDAVIGGWSGGPVLNQAGQVVGMVVALSPSQKDSGAVMEQPPTGVFIASGAEPMRAITQEIGLNTAAPYVPEFPGAVDPSNAVVRVFCWR